MSVAMPSETASWHPAFMPNSAADLASKELTRPSSPTPAPDHHLESAEPPHTHPATVDSNDAEEVMIPEHEDTPQHPEPTNLENAPTTALASPGAVELDETQPPNGIPEQDAISEDGRDNTPEGSTANKHMSTMSFARTVSEEVSLGEDDDIDPEWNLHRTDTDPFKLMPKSDRTNSFPQVPPTHPSGVGFEPLPSQAEEIINEVEQEPRDLFSDDEHSGDADFFAQTAAQEASHDFPRETNNEHESTDYGQTYGGNVLQEKDQEMQARYEEGVPLVESLPNHEQAPATNSPAFMDDAGDEDDFFAQVSKTHQATEEPQEPRPLGRKSTEQVMDSLSFEPHEKTHDGAPENSQSSLERATGGGIAVSASTVLSEVLGDPEAPIHEQPENLANLEMASGEGDLAEKWKAALAGDEFLDDEELLPDDEPAESKALDPADLFGSDDEGFLEDTEEQDAAVETPSQPGNSPIPGPVTTPNGHVVGFDSLTGAVQSPSRPGSSRYIPAGAAATVPQSSNPYAPPAPQFTDLSRPRTASAVPAAYAPPISNFPASQPPQQRPELPKAQSFADKSKGGYSSPYDLPMEVVKPRKRSSMQHLNRGFNQSAPPPTAPPIAPPPRSASMYTQPPPPSRGSTSSLSPPPTSHSFQQSPQESAAVPATQGPPPPSLKSKASSSNFFEDLPVSSRPKPAARHSASSQTQGHFAPSGAPPQPSSGQGYTPPPPPPTHPAQGLVAPERVSPYASLPSNTATVPPVASRYSPAPPQPHAQAAPPPVAQSRYSPAPPVSRQAAQAYGVPLANGPPPPILPHLPRTSSPLAHFERTQDSGTHSSQAQVPSFGRRSSSSYESSLKPHHLPPTREVDEDEQTSSDERNHSDLPNQYGQRPGSHPPPVTRPVSQTPPPPQGPASRIPYSPPKHAMSNYQPSGNTTPPQAFVPPKRSQTQSPGTAYTGPRLGINTSTPIPRPASAEVPLSPRSNAGLPPMPNLSPGRARTFSTGLNYIAPTDGREHDPLQRWKGAPVFAWGVGGALVTSFPKDVPRYVNQAPMVIRTPGEVKIRNIKDVDPLQERLSTFPGPLKGKSKKKDVVSWLSSGIEILEQNASYLQSIPTLTHEDKRTEERILLWKILRIFIENDGILEGNAVVDKAVRSVLSPGVDMKISGNEPLYATGADLSSISHSATTDARADPVDPAAIDELKKHLLGGDREKAVWEAVDKRLWGHAMLISNTVSKALYKQVAQEFVQKEVQNIYENSESLAALYEIFAGNFEESIDELVPPSARAGFKMVSTSNATGPSKGALDGLDKWRETLGLVLSNRSVDDSQALNALGKLLSGYGRAEAAHICFLFARSHSVFGGIDDPLSSIVLVGSDHLRQPYEFDKELEPILLSEVFDYGISLSNVSVAVSSPHLSIYKLQHAKILAEYGYREKALQYCEAIASSMTAQTRRSPYHHALLVAELDDFSQRLKQSPKDEKSSWVSKPSIDKVSSSVWSTFNKFVAGDDADTGTPGSTAGGAAEVGPFARIAGGTPTISRSPSVADMYGSFNGGMGPNGSPATKAGSRYAPGNAYSPPTYEPQSAASYQSAPLYGLQSRGSFEERSSERSSDENRRGPYEPVRRDTDYRPSSQPTMSAPQNGSIYTPHLSYAPHGNGSLYEQMGSPYASHRLASAPELPSSHSAGNMYDQPTASYTPPEPSYEPPVSSGYEPPSNGSESFSGGYEPPSSGYEPPSSGYEPPSFERTTMNDEPDSPVETRPKKKSFLDDDEDDIPALKAVPAAREKTKAEKDREADEAFRKAAEADGMSFPFLPQ